MTEASAHSSAPAPRAAQANARSRAGSSRRRGHVGATHRDGAGPAGPQRMCVGCGQRESPERLVRLVVNDQVDGPATTLVPDVRGGALGRGVHLHPRRACLEAAATKGFARSLKREVRVDVDQLAEQLRVAFERRFMGLLGGGIRGGHVAIGTDSVLDVCRSRTAKLVLIAADAGGVATRPELRAVEPFGALVVFVRLRLAEMLGRSPEQAPEGVAVCAVTSSGLAAEVRRTFLNSQAWSTTDVRAQHSGRTQE